MKTLLLLFFSFFLTTIFCQNLHIDFTNMDGTKPYRHLGIIPSQVQNDVIHYGFYGPSYNDAIFLQLNPNDLSQEWGRKIVNGQNDMFTGNWIVEHLGEQDFLKVNFNTYSPAIGNSFPMSLGFGKYEDFSPVSGTTKYFENAFSAYDFLSDDLYPVVSYHKRINDNTLLVSGNVMRDVNGFSRSVFPQIVKMSTDGDIIWSKAFVSEDNDYVVVNQIEIIDEDFAYVLGFYHTESATLTSINQLFVGKLNLNNGGMEKVNVFDAVEPYWGGGFYNTSMKVVNGAIFLIGGIAFLDNSPGSEFYDGSFICKLNNDLQTIDWFANYNGSIIDFSIDENGTGLVALFENVIVDEVQFEIVDYYYRICKVDLTNKGAILANKEILGNEGVSYNYIYQTEGNYTLGYSTLESGNDHHHVFTVDKDDLSSCELDVDKSDIFITTNDIVLDHINTIEFEIISDLFVNNTLTYTPFVGGVEVDLLEPKTLCLVDGLEDVDVSKDIIVYPNPMTNDLYIENDSKYEIQSISIFNILGQLVLENNSCDIIQTDSFSPGVYTIVITTSKSTFQQQVVKE